MFGIIGDLSNGIAGSILFLMNVIRVDLDGLVSLLEKEGKMDENGKNPNFYDCSRFGQRTERQTFERCP